MTRRRKQSLDDLIPTLLRANVRGVILLALGVFIASGRPAATGGTSYTGALATDDATAIFAVTLPTAGPLVVRTYSYAGGTNQAGTAIPPGGFDPTVSLYDSLGNLLVSNRDGGCGAVNADPVTQYCWDSFLSLTLPAGNYSVVLTQSENLPNGPTLADSFVYAGQTTFTAPPGRTSGFWDLLPSHRTNSYAIDILGGASTVTSITSPSQLPIGIAGSAYGPIPFTAQAASGAILQWSIASGSLPPGLALNQGTGVLSGTPLGSGTFPITVQVTDGALPVVTQSYVLTIDNPLSISATLLPSATGGQSYGPVSLTASGGSGDYSWSGSGFPSGITLSTAGVISGTTTHSGSFPVGIVVSDPIAGISAAANLTLTVYSPLTISTTSLPSATGGQSYGPVSLAASGGSGSYSWSGTGFPSGITLTAGVISGTTTHGGSFPISIVVSDPILGISATANLTLTVSFPALTITSSGALGGFVPSANVSGSFAATGGLAPYAWSAAGLPAGFSLNSSTGAFSGTAGDPGVYHFSVGVTDSESPAMSANLTVAYSVLGITTSALPDGSTTAAYSATLNATGGTGSYSFTASGLPAGFSLSGSGALTGTPKAAGTFTVTITVTSGGLSASSTFALTVAGPVTQTLSVSAATLPAGTASAPYVSASGLQATGGSPPYTWSVFAGILPAGMSLSGSGSLSGTPAAAGSYPFTAEVTDAKGVTATGPFTLTINPPALTSSIGTLPTGIVGVTYPLQVLTASGGTAPYTFALGTGALPGGLTLSSQEISGVPTAAGTYSFTIGVTDAAGKTTAASGSIVINPPQTGLILSSTSLSFSLIAGAGGVPPADQVTIRSSNSLAPLNYTFTASPSVSWLDVSGGGTTPGSLTIAIDASAPSLPASTTPYSTTVTVACTSSLLCAGGAQNISVTLYVTAPPPQLLVSSSIVSLSASSANPSPSSQPLGLQNSGGGEIDIGSITTGAGWLTVSGTPSTLTAGPATAITLTENPSGLSPGYYTTTLTVSSSAGMVTIPVTLLVTQALTMTLGPSGAQFSAPAGSTPGNTDGSFNISVSGSGTETWTASVLPGENWLMLNSPSGTASSSSAASVGYSLNASVIASLAPAAYYATIEIDSADVADSPQQYQVVLDITPPATAVSPVLSSAGIIFTAGLGGTSPPQSIVVYSASGTPAAYQASAATTDGASWLAVSPALGSASAGSAGQSTISVNAAGLAPGVYSGGVTYAFSSDSVSTVNVTLLVLKGGAVPSLRGGQPAVAEASGCTPTQVIGTQTGLYNNFAQAAGWPSPLSVSLIDDCNNPVNGASLITTFSNGDPPLALSPRDSSSGIYLGTWTPRIAAPQVTVTATATIAPFAPAIAQVTGQVRTNGAPILTPNAVLDVFNPVIGAGLAPGEVIQIYGSNLAPQTTLAPAPLPDTLSGTSVLIGGIQAPLFYVSPGQINAQIPFGLTPGTQYQILADVNGALSTPAPIQIVSTTPGIANIGGQIIAQHSDYSPVTPDAPAQPGEYVVIYLSGLGATDNSVASGAVTPVDPLSHPVVPPTLMFNGVAVPTAFIGLTPSAVGLYQINFQIPADAPAGNLTLSVNQGSAAANQGVLPIGSGSAQ